MPDSSNNESPNKVSWLSHPMVNVIVGFLLTGVVGTIITQHFFDRRQEEQLQAQYLQHRKSVIESIAQRIAEFQMRTEILVNELQSGAGASSAEELAKQKETYDSAFINWRTDNPAAFLLVKDLLSPTEYRRFRMNVERKLHNGAILPVRECVRKAYATSTTHPEQVAKILDECDIRGRLQIINQCTNIIAEQLHELTGETVGVSAGISVERRAELDRQVKQKCP